MCNVRLILLEGLIVRWKETHTHRYVEKERVSATERERKRDVEIEAYTRVLVVQHIFFIFCEARNDRVEGEKGASSPHATDSKGSTRSPVDVHHHITGITTVEGRLSYENAVLTRFVPQTFGTTLRYSSREICRRKLFARARKVHVLCDNERGDTTGATQRTVLKKLLTTAEIRCFGYDRLGRNVANCNER